MDRENRAAPPDVKTGMLFGVVCQGFVAHYSLNNSFSLMLASAATKCPSHCLSTQFSPQRYAGL